MVELWSLKMMMIAPVAPTHAAGCEGSTTGGIDFWEPASSNFHLSSAQRLWCREVPARKVKWWLEMEHKSRHFEIAVLGLRLLKKEFPGIQSDRWWGTSAPVYSWNWNALGTSNFCYSQKVQNMSAFWKVMTSVFCCGRVVHV